MQLDTSGMMFGQPLIESSQQQFFGDEIEQQNSFIDDRAQRRPSKKRTAKFGGSNNMLFTNKLALLDHNFHDETA